MEQGALVKLILTVIVGFLLVGLAYMAVNFFSSLSDRDACRLSVEAASKTKVVQESPVFKDLNCKTQFIEVTDKTIRKNDKLIATLNKEPQYRVKKAIASEIYDCWYQMGEGKLDPWGDWQIGQHTKHCMVCSEISFDKAQIKQIENLDEFLNKEKIPQTGQTYSDYITKGKGFSPMTFDTSSQISIIYQVDDVSNVGTMSGYTMSGCIVGAGAGAGVGTIFAGVGAVPGALIGGAGGCIGGFASGIIEVVFTENHEAGLLHPALIIKKTKDISPGECDVLY